MAEVPKRGATARTDGSFERPPSDGVVDGALNGQYRKPPVKQVNIDEITYVPYGDVYERRTPAELDLEPTGGVFERAPEVVSVLQEEFMLSLTYPPLVTDSMAHEITILSGTLMTATVDQMAIDITLLSGTLASPLLTYPDWPPESLAIDTTIVSGTLVVALIVYNNWPVESMAIDATIVSGTLVGALISYENWPAESMAIDTLITGGTLV